MGAANSSSTILRLSRVFDAPIERVFEAWTSPAELMAWFGPEGCVVDSVEADLRVGGCYSIDMTVPGGEKVHHFGVYLEVDPPERLVFTWVLSDQPCKGGRGQDADTTVFLDLSAIGSKTELTLVHERLPGAEVVEAHRVGWSGSLSCLDSHISAS